ncbi:MAG: hypothetical protein ABL901_20035 [Hyphomicrobiaceae bacterium]
MKLRGLILLAAILGASPAFAEPSIPAPLNPAVTAETAAQTICVRGWTKGQRSGWYSRRLKIQLLAVLGLPPEARHAYQLDHYIPLTLGGDARAVGNFALQPIEDARRKDRLERKLGCLVCTGQVQLSDAQRAISEDWGAAYHAYARLKCRRPGRAGAAAAVVP